MAPQREEERTRLPIQDKGNWLFGRVANFQVLIVIATKFAHRRANAESVVTVKTWIQSEHAFRASPSNLKACRFGLPSRDSGIDSIHNEVGKHTYPVAENPLSVRRLDIFHSIGFDLV